MKRVLRFAAVNTLGVAILAAGMPLQAAAHRENNQWEGGNGARNQSAWSHPQQRDNNYRQDQRDDHGYREDRPNWGDRDRGEVYATPNYYANGYGYPEGGYVYRDGHAGRTAAIIGGSAAAGALIGAAAGHGQGAAIGAVVGGVAGVIASQAVRHHDHP
jgi:hypothetical protein